MNRLADRFGRRLQTTCRDRRSECGRCKPGRHKPKASAVCCVQRLCEVRTSSLLVARLAGRDWWAGWCRSTDGLWDVGPAVINRIRPKMKSARAFAPWPFALCGLLLGLLQFSLNARLNRRHCDPTHAAIEIAFRLAGRDQLKDFRLAPAA